MKIHDTATMYTLTTPQPTDYPTLLTIWEASVRATHHFLKEEDIVFFKEFIQQEHVFDHVELTIVQDAEGEVLGFMGVSGDSLEMIFLTPQIRGRGIGKVLVRYAIDELKIRKVDVNEQNDEAQKFYEHLGFRVKARSEVDGTGKPYPILHMEVE